VEGIGGGEIGEGWFGVGKTRGELVGVVLLFEGELVSGGVGGCF
jgi:hypothetical protein